MFTFTEEHTITSLLGSNFTDKIREARYFKSEPLLPEYKPPDVVPTVVLPQFSGFFTKTADPTISDFYPEIKVANVKKDSLNDRAISWINKNRDLARIILIGVFCTASFLFGYSLK